MPRYIEEPYRTPPGSLDAPFIYVYDASSLTDGLTYNNVALPIQGDSDFVLRAIRGVNTVVDAAPIGAFDYKNPNGTYTSGEFALLGVAAIRGIFFPRNWPVVPEKLFKANTSIQFDLTNVLRANTACALGAIYYSQIAFCGVKRFSVQQGYTRGDTDYDYRSMQFSYSVALTLTWGYWDGVARAIPRRIQIPMEQYDFELLRMKVCLASGATGALTTPDVQVTVYDANMHQLSDKPLNQAFINSGKVAANRAPLYQGVFPVPPLVYPKGSQITLDVSSMVCNNDPRLTPGIQYNLLLDGLWRVPVNRYDR